MIRKIFNILKMILKTWDSDVFGTTSSFYEMLTVHFLLKPISVSQVLKKSQFCVLIVSIFVFWAFWLNVSIFVLWALWLGMKIG